MVVHPDAKWIFSKCIVIKKIQGEWKETGYRFLWRNLKINSKFIEEGLVEEPRFREYKILKVCPFDDASNGKFFID